MNHIQLPLFMLRKVNATLLIVFRLLLSIQAFNHDVLFKYYFYGSSKPESHSVTSVHVT